MKHLLQALAELLHFGVAERKVAVLMLALILLLLGGIVVIAERSVVLPLIYTIF